MSFHNSKIHIFLTICALNTFFAISQGPLTKSQIDSTLNFTLNTQIIDELVNNDSLYKAATLLNDAITHSKQHGLIEIEARTYNTLGKVLTKMSNYSHAESYHKKALKIYDSINNYHGKVIAFSGLVNTYLRAKNYGKFDNIYPLAQQSSKALNSELYFVNLEKLIIKNYYTNKNSELLRITNFAIDTLQNLKFNKENSSKSYNDKILLKNRLLKSYQYHKAIAQVKLADHSAEGFNYLLSLNETKLKDVLANEPDSKRKLATFNYYKYLYYTEAEKNLDSALKYLLKSDSYKYAALDDFDDRNATNGDLIYKIISTEQELKLANEISKKDASASQIFMGTTILVSLLFTITLIILLFYFKVRKRILKINDELKNSNDKLIQNDKDRSEFLSILSHELRTPIYGISGLATLIDQENDEVKRKSYLDSLISSSNYLSILIDNTLQANKLRFEEKNLRLKPDKINKVIKHVLSTVEVAAKNKGLRLKTNIDPSDDNEYVLIDKVAFSQILINLAYNAIRYTKEGHISINVIEKQRTPESVTLRFEVNDTGIGIKEEHRSVVFNAFENQTFLHKNSSGSGLGLYIVKTLLKSHQSKIDFTSKVGVGSSFFFEIEFTIASSPTLKRSIKTTSKSKHILIVDDNKVNLLITKKNVEKIEGFTCEIMSKGREAISMVKEKAFDLVLMDINMPDMDGYEVTKHIRMFNPHIPILALTALNSSEIALKAEHAGINHIITKPYIYEDFKTTVLSHIEKSNPYFKAIALEAI